MVSNRARLDEPQQQNMSQQSSCLVNTRLHGSKFQHQIQNPKLSSREALDELRGWEFHLADGSSRNGGFVFPT